MGRKEKGIPLNQIWEAVKQNNERGSVFTNEPDPAPHKPVILIPPDKQSVFEALGLVDTEPGEAVAVQGDGREEPPKLNRRARRAAKHAAKRKKGRRGYRNR